jgi:hypothetical protein
MIFEHKGSTKKHICVDIFMNIYTYIYNLHTVYILYVHVRDGARIKYKLMGFMVYF